MRVRDYTVVFAELIGKNSDKPAFCDRQMQCVYGLLTPMGPGSRGTVDYLDVTYACCLLTYLSRNAYGEFFHRKH